MRRIVQRERTGRDQCGVFAETVTRQVRRNGTARFRQTRHTATPAASSAGWVYSVRLSIDFRPALRKRPEIDAGTVDASANVAG